MNGRPSGCRNPSVTNCLNCNREECDAPSNCSLDVSEIKALVYVGMLPLSALGKHHGAIKRAQKRRLKLNENHA